MLAFTVNCITYDSAGLSIVFWIMHNGLDCEPVCDGAGLSCCIRVPMSAVCHHAVQAHRSKVGAGNVVDHGIGDDVTKVGLACAHHRGRRTLQQHGCLADDLRLGLGSA